MGVSSMTKGEHRKVATAAGVEPALVGQYLAGKHVGPERREKIEGALRKLKLADHIVQTKADPRG